jgi:5-carboxymethyl-2-hydroxymuconate isomerase
LCRFVHSHVTSSLQLVLMSATVACVVSTTCVTTTTLRHKAPAADTAPQTAHACKAAYTHTSACVCRQTATTDTICGSLVEALEDVLAHVAHRDLAVLTHLGHLLAQLLAAVLQPCNQTHKGHQAYPEQRRDRGLKIFKACLRLLSSSKEQWQ